ncbi:YciI family protein [Chthonobacter rhizosphaerae]|uniref:YciI family protein n=1 Tax=Chthonobacter rhizosphaerae TaxID=2735553 RepID=UPI0015EEEC14|nr:YciI family protein [Chthonobacter rhizosphaerae]
MHYMILFYEPEAVFTDRTKPEMATDYWGAWTSYVGALAESGVVVSGNALQAPHAATTVRLRDGERLVQDGPVAATKEQLGGYFIVDVPDLDTAIAWAARSPSARYGSTEIRPVLPPMAAPA